MTIQQGDIKIMASQVLADVAEGGGAATGTEIVDGQSNNLFPDISELDRVIGRVNLRKVFPSVRTVTTDGYNGVNVIVSDIPDDPAVGAFLFKTGEYFDTRDDAQKRLEAYLVRGTPYDGLLFGDHIEGMRTVTLLQRESSEIPGVGSTIYLIQDQGLAAEASQYVRATKISHRVREFAVPGQGEKTFRRRELTMELSDPLRSDFNGFEPADSYDDSRLNYTAKTRVFQTVVADAAEYFSTVTLAEPIALGSFSGKVNTIFSQIVPSAQVESALADARMNQQTGAITPTGADWTQSLTLHWTTTQAMYVGGGIAPGTLNISREGVVVTDRAGRLIRNGADVGGVDYANGVLTLATNLWVTGGTHQVVYQPAGQLTVVTRSIGVPVTQQSQSRTQVVSLTPIPAPASLQVSYLSGGQWYVLTETGTGALAGADSSIGAGQLNYSTGTVTLTMGALPDIGSQVIYSWAPTQDRATVPTSALDNAARAFFDFTVGALEPGSLTLAWNNGAARTAADSAGALTGDATGKVWYGGGRIQFSPASMPPPGTVLTWTVTAAQQRDEITAGLTDAGAAWSWTLPGAPIKPRSLQLAIAGTIPVRQSSGTDANQTSLYRVLDDGAGALYVVSLTGNLVVGSVNYATGAVSLTKTTAGFVSSQGNWERVTPIGDPNINPSYVVYNGNSNRTTGLTLRGNFTDVETLQPPWAWWSSTTGAGAIAQYAGASGTSTTGTVALTEAKAAAELGSYPTRWGPVYYSWYTVNFKMGTSTYQTDGKGGATILKDVNPLTGEGTDVGLIVGTTATFTDWPAGASSTLVDVRTGAAAPFSGSRDVLTDAVIFRTATAPIKPSSLQITGTLEDGTAISATADAQGQIISTYIKGKVDVATGVVVLRFGQDTATPSDPINPGAGKINLSYLGLAGVNWVDSKQVQADTLRYNAVAYSYIPLDADILGLDPVRLPSDGRAPVFRPGTIAVIHNTQTTSPQTVTAGQTVNLGRTRLSRVRVIGADGATIHAGYSANLNAGTVTFSSVTGYSQPIRIEHRIEDAATVSSAQITGQLAFTRPITHDYPASTSMVSSALVIGDMQARVSRVFDQASWTNVWSDDLIGDPAGGTFNTIDYPPTVNNLGAVTERWVLRFTGATAFQIIGEHLGLIGTGNTSTDCAPVNPASGQPYFNLPALGWGGGWATGNALRLNTIGAIAPVWVGRVIQQSQPTTDSDSFSILVRGDIDNPA